MEDTVLYVAAIVLLAAQILCFFAKKVWIRLIPLVTVAALAMFCFVMYAVSGFTNWGYLILLALVFFVLLVMGLMWMFYGLYRWKKL